MTYIDRLPTVRISTALRIGVRLNGREVFARPKKCQIEFVFLEALLFASRMPLQRAYIAFDEKDSRVPPSILGVRIL